MNKILKNILQVVGVCVLSALITLLVFKTMGWYAFNMLPTKVVVIRMLISSGILAIMLEVILLVFRRIKRG